MEYVFGAEGGVEVLKVVSNEPGEMAPGGYTIKRDYTDSTITDTFMLISKIRESEDDGLYYKWYTIAQHYRYEDKFTPGILATEQEITEQELALMEAEQTITDLDLRVMELEAAQG